MRSVEVGVSCETAQIRDIHQLIKADNQSLHVTTPAAEIQSMRRRYAPGVAWSTGQRRRKMERLWNGMIPGI